MKANPGSGKSQATLIVTLHMTVSLLHSTSWLWGYGGADVLDTISIIEHEETCCKFRINVLPDSTPGHCLLLTFVHCLCCSI